MKKLAKTNNLSFLLARIFYTIQFFVFVAFSVKGQNANLNPLLNNELTIERLTVEEGLASNYVSNLLQYRKGFMWFATQEGLQKFDGYTTTLNQNNPNESNSLSHNNVSFIYEDKAGYLWIGTADGGINKFDPQQDRVRDNGVGIPENVLQRIFQPFFTTKPTGEGTGLGLSLNFEIITKVHGGSLTVDSEEEGNTEFIIRLEIFPSKGSV